MAFPVTPLPVRLELLIGAVWEPATAPDNEVRGDEQTITVTRGRDDNAAEPSAGTSSFVVDNANGKYTPDNPLSEYYGQLKLNTPVRCSVDQGARYLWIADSDALAAATPDAAALDITGDIDIRIELDAQDWRASGVLASKWLTTANLSWAFFLHEGRPTFTWTTGGTSATQLERAAEDSDLEAVLVPIPASGRLALRVTLDVNVGGTSNTTTFYTSDSISGTWTQLGEAITLPGVTSIFSGTSPLSIGEETINAILYSPVVGRVHKLEVRSGIGGSAVANPDFTTQTAGASSFADGTGKTWTITDSEISQRRWRFNHEVSSLPPEWDPSGSDVTATIEGAGCLRRLRAGDEPLDSSLYRALVAEHGAGTIALEQYWPCEEVRTSARGFGRFASAMGGPSMFITKAEPNLGADDSFVASSPLPQLNNDQWQGEISAYAHSPSDGYMFHWLQRIVDASVNGQTIIEFECTNAIWRVRYETGGTLRLTVVSGDGDTVLQDNTGLFTNLITIPTMLTLELVDDGANIDWMMHCLNYNMGVISETSGTVTSRRLRRAERVRVSPGGGLDDIVIGHIMFHNMAHHLDDDYPAGYWHDVLHGWEGETAGRRAKRLCEEEGVPFRAIGDLDETVPMGPQQRLTLGELLLECARTDQGIMYEPTDVCGIGYRTRKSLANQTAVVLDYEANELAGAFTPVYDDQRIRNDITVRDASGAFARRFQRTGPLAVLPPHDGGIGRYDHQVDVNVAGDVYLDHLANLVLLYGTQPLMRYPSVSVALHRSQLVADEALTTALLELRPGDRIVVDNLPSWMPDDKASLIVEGIQPETMSNLTHDITFMCVPEDPHHVGIFDGADWVYAGEEPRYDGESTLVAGVDGDDTSLSVASTGFRWIDSAAWSAHFPFKIKMNGEIMTVTAISGTSSPQTFTVTRNVNGKARSHAAGSVLSLAYPAHYDL